jgi:uncharacterized repeat protein (TIGR01451 family)
VRLLGVLTLLCTLLVVAGLPGRQSPAHAATVCPTTVSLVNGDFEAPALPVDNSYKIMSQTLVPGWQTSATDKMIEIWRTPFSGVTAASGMQHAELNANMVSTLYQSVTTTPGQTLRWELKHRGRQGTDTMELLIGTSLAGLVSQGTFADAKTWGTYSGTYVVPGGQSTTLFAFRSVSSTGGATIGNFLDGIVFGTSACLTAATTASTTSANVGDLVTYTVTARNEGGNPALSTVLADDLPAGVTFVPGSIRSINGSTTTTVSDAADADPGEYDAVTRTVRVRAGTVQPAEGRSFTYQARVTSANAASTVGNDAVVSYTDPLTATARTATSTPASTTVAASADLAVTATTSAVVAGGTATTTLTARNNGPNAAAAPQISLTLPAGATGPTAVSSAPGASCTTTASLARCDLLSLAAGATATMTVTVGLPAATPPGTQATLTASAASTTYELTPADNATSISGTVTALADLGVTMTNTPAVVGGPITYTVTISNAGPSVATGVVFTDVLPRTTATLTGYSGGTCAPTPIGTLECQVADLAPGGSATVTVNMTLNQGSSVINNAVSVTSATPDPSATNNNFSVQTAGTLAADVGVKLSLSQLSAYAGDTVEYTLTVTNRGPTDAASVTFNTITPPGVTIVRSSPYCTANACTVGTLRSGQTVELRGNAILGPNATAGPGFASTTVISPTYDPDSSNDTDTVNFTVLLSADLAVAQTLTNPSDPATLVAGQDVRGVVTVTNNGRTRAEGVVMSQAIPATRPVPGFTTVGGGTCTFQGTVAGGFTPDGGAYVCTVPALAAGGTWEIDFGDVLLNPGYSTTVYTRTAVVSATTADPVAGNDSVTTTKPVIKRSDLRVVKTTSTPVPVQSEEVRFQVAVTNLGPSDATSVTIQESTPNGLLITGGTPGAGTTFDPAQLAWRIPVLPADPMLRVATLTLFGAAQVSGPLTATASVAASGSTDPVGGNDSDSAVITVSAAQPSLSVQNTATVTLGQQSGVQAGNTIAYQYDITNNGNLAMTTLTVTGSVGGAANCGGVTDLAPGATVTCTGATHTVSALEVSNGLPIADTVTVTAITTLAAGAVPYATVTASIPIARAQPSLVAVVNPVVSPAARQHAAAVGDTVAFTYSVTNNGDRRMDSIAVTDTLGGGITCGLTSLNPGASTTCTAATGYTVLQSDVDAGLPIAGSAQLTSIPAGGVSTTFGPFSTPVTPAPATPAVTLTVTAVASPPVAVGDPIGYGYRVTNSGNVTVHGVSVADALIPTVNCAGGPDVAPGAHLDCTSAAPYAVVQNDLDAGHPVRDDALATALTPAGAPVTAPGSDAVTMVPATPALTVASTATVAPAGHTGAVRAGDLISFQYTVTNAGNVTMRSIRVADSLAGTTLCAAGPIAVHASVSCAGSGYVVTQNDVDAGIPLIATARAGGRAPGSPTVTDYGSISVTLPVVAADLQLQIAAEAVITPATHQSAAEEGDHAGFRFLVTNAGNVTAREVDVTADLAGGVDCPSATVGVGGSMTCTSRTGHAITRAEVDAGKTLTPEAYVSGRGPSPVTVRFGPAVSHVLLAVAAPSLIAVVTPVVDPPAHQGAAEPGDRITWSYLVTNNGNVTIEQIALTGSVICPKTTLAVREAMTCTATDRRTVTQDDVDRGEPITGAVSVSGVSPSGPGDFGPFSANVAPAPAVPSLLLTMAADVAPAGHASAVRAGDKITYRYAVRNAGNTTISRIALSDSRTGASTCPAASLAVGAAMSCTSARAYAVTQQDVDAGKTLEATATLTGARLSGTTVVTMATGALAVRVATAAPRLAAKQTAAWADRDGDGRLGVRDDVVSTIVVTNTGNVTVFDLTVNGLPAGVTCSPTTLAPGESATCHSGVYHLTGADIASGRRTYEAHAEGELTDSSADPVRVVAPSTVVVPAAPSPTRSPSLSPSPSKSGGGHGVEPISAPVTGPPSLPVFILGWSLIGGGLALLALTRLRRRPGKR